MDDLKEIRDKIEQIRIDYELIHGDNALFKRIFELELAINCYINRTEDDLK